MPLRDDYMMRLIEQLTETVGVLVGMRKRREPEQELQTIDEALKRMLGLNGKLVIGLSEPDLVALLTKDGYGELERLAAVAVLLKEEGDAFSRLGQERSAYAVRKKALYLLLHIGSRGAEVSFVKLHEEIDGLLTLLRPYAWPAELKRELWRYYEEIGRYAAAEDVLYELLEEADGGADMEARSKWYKEALAFYERLEKLNQDKLEAGNLPLVEVKDALLKLSGREKP